MFEQSEAPGLPDVAKRATIRLATDAAVWQWALFACAILAALSAATAPLADPDLPMHLAVGEWIWTHRTVPYVEPFAWTRYGSPYYAYSWLAQLLYYGTMRVAGSTGLHVLAATLALATVTAGAVMARAFRLSPPAVAVIGFLSAFIADASTPFLRPQQFLFAIVPLCWACVARLKDEDRPRADALLVLLVLSALAANTHIGFVVTATPLALMMATKPLPWRALQFTTLAIVAGWFISPYAFVWPEVFHINFTPNLITTTTGVVGELRPGFTVAPLVGAALAITPLLAFPRLTPRARIVYGAWWFAGIVSFAIAFKALGPWWWCSTPLLVTVLGQLPDTITRHRAKVAALGLVFVAAALALPNVLLFPRFVGYEGTLQARQLPSIKAFAAEPIARWLESNARADFPGRLLTTFEYGSYLKWRLPALSESIDSRNIFPDSVVLSTSDSARPIRLGPWRAADVAVLPADYPLATVLDRDSAWRRIMVASPPPWAPSARRGALWVRRSWWAKASKLQPPS
jgi:hypothetical protein